METGKEVFEGKNVANLLEELYKKQSETNDLIVEQFTHLSEFVSTPGDAIVISPLLKDLLDSKLKNDETLLKMVQLFKQPAQQTKASDKEEDTGIISQKDIEQLYSEVNLRSTYVKELTNK